MSRHPPTHTPSGLHLGRIEVAFTRTGFQGQGPKGKALWWGTQVTSQQTSSKLGSTLGNSTGPGDSAGASEETAWRKHMSTEANRQSREEGKTCFPLQVLYSPHPYTPNLPPRGTETHNKGLWDSQLEQGGGGDNGAGCKLQTEAIPAVWSWAGDSVSPC